MRHPNIASVHRVLLAALFAVSFAGARPAAAVVVGARADALADSHVLASVGDRKITVYDYRSGWYLSDATLRPRPDSLGRTVFLRDLVDKELLGQASQQTGYQFSFQDRIDFRNYRSTLLSNLLFATSLKGAGEVGDDSLRKITTFYGRDLKLRLLYLPTREQAEFTRLQLIGGRTTWTAALGKYAVHSTTVTNGMSDWMKFANLPLDVALPIWSLRMGEVSPVIPAASGFHVVQIAEERKGTVLPFSAMRSVVRNRLRELESTQRRSLIQDEAKQGMSMVYDSTNVRWAASFFRQSMRVESEGLGGNMVIDPNVPEFAPADTARTLASWTGGRLSLGNLVHEYSDMQPLTRPSLNTVERMLAFADAVILGPRMTTIAEKRGIDKDSTAVAFLARKREEILVTHMVEDSILSRITVAKDERRAYYLEHPQDFTTFPRVKYGALVRTSRGAADSTRTMLERGASFDSLLAIDKARGVVGSGMNEIASNEPSDYHKILFEELRPGKATIIGPDRDKLYAVMYEIAYDPGHVLSYEEMESPIDESVRNIKGDQALRAFIARLESRFPVVAHPELVMRITLTDPAGTGD